MALSAAQRRFRFLPPGVVALLALQACVYVPRTTEHYDEACRVRARQMTLEVAQLGGFRGCANQGCVALLAAAGALTAASVVVSGSIAVVGNVVYWAEKQGRCVRAGPADSEGPSAAPRQ